MNPSAIIKALQDDGVSLTLAGDRILAQPRDKVTPDKLSLLRDNKTSIIEFLKLKTCPPSDTVEQVEVSNQALAPTDVRLDPSAPHKTYTLEDGTTISMTRDEFDDVVDIFRMLLEADHKISAPAIEAGEGDVPTK